MDRPANARFAESHEWVIVDGDTATLGVSDFAIEHLGDLVFVDLPEAGGDIEKGGTASPCITDHCKNRRWDRVCVQ